MARTAASVSASSFTSGSGGDRAVRPGGGSGVRPAAASAGSASGSGGGHYHQAVNVAPRKSGGLFGAPPLRQNPQRVQRPMQRSNTARYVG